MRTGRGCDVIPQKVLAKSFCKGQLPHKSVNVSSIITNFKNKLTESCRNGLLKNICIHNFCEIRLRLRRLWETSRFNNMKERMD